MLHSPPEFETFCVVHSETENSETSTDCWIFFISSTARDFWQAKGPSEILDRLQRGDLSIEAAALALGVNPANLAAYVADISDQGKWFVTETIKLYGIKSK